MKLWSLSLWNKISFVILLLVIPIRADARFDSFSHIDPLKIYPKNIEFTVLRNKEIVGKHRVLFNKIESDKLRVTADFNIKVSFLKIPLYHFNYKSDAIWYNGNLFSLVSTQNEDGVKSTVKVFIEKNKLVIDGPKKNIKTDMNTYPSNHWNARIVFKDKLINTLKGELSSVTITKIGVETINAQGRSISAIKYTYSGDVDASVWYTEEGRWVKLKFEGHDGSSIDYECVECGLGKSLSRKGRI
jgi:hypothetical protein